MASGALSSIATSAWLVGLAVSLAINLCQFLIRGGLGFFKKSNEKSGSFLLPKHKVIPK
jgi:hypothetical protein